MSEFPLCQCRCSIIARTALFLTVLSLYLGTVAHKIRDNCLQIIQFWDQIPGYICMKPRPLWTSVMLVGTTAISSAPALNASDIVIVSL